MEYLSKKGYSVCFENLEFSVLVTGLKDGEKVFEFGKTKADAMDTLEKFSVSAKQGYLPIDLLEQLAVNLVYRIGGNKVVSLVVDRLA